MDEYGKYYEFDEDEMNSIIENEKHATSIEAWNSANNLFNEIKEEAEAAKKLATTITYSSGYYGNGSGLTKSGGVNYFSGRKETYYSSRVLHHYRTNE